MDASSIQQDRNFLIKIGLPYPGEDPTFDEAVFDDIHLRGGGNIHGIAKALGYAAGMSDVWAASDTGTPQEAHFRCYIETKYKNIIDEFRSPILFFGFRYSLSGGVESVSCWLIRYRFADPSRLARKISEARAKLLEVAYGHEDGHSDMPFFELRHSRCPRCPGTGL